VAAHSLFHTGRRAGEWLASNGIWCREEDALCPLLCCREGRPARRSLGPLPCFPVYARNRERGASLRRDNRIVFSRGQPQDRPSMARAGRSPCTRCTLLRRRRQSSALAFALRAATSAVIVYIVDLTEPAPLIDGMPTLAGYVHDCPLRQEELTCKTSKISRSCSLRDLDPSSAIESRAEALWRDSRSDTHSSMRQ